MDRTVYQFHIFYLARLKSEFFRSNLEDIIVENGLFIGFLYSRFTRISPKFLLDFVIRGEFESIVKRCASYIFDSYKHFAWSGFIFGRNIAKIPIVMF